MEALLVGPEDDACLFDLMCLVDRLLMVESVKGIEHLSFSSSRGWLQAPEGLIHQSSSFYEADAVTSPLPYCTVMPALTTSNFLLWQVEHCAILILPASLTYLTESNLYVDNQQLSATGVGNGPVLALTTSHHLSSNQSLCNIYLHGW